MLNVYCLILLTALHTTVQQYHVNFLFRMKIANKKRCCKRFFWYGIKMFFATMILLYNPSHQVTSTLPSLVAM